MYAKGKGVRWYYLSHTMHQLHILHTTLHNPISYSLHQIQLMRKNVDDSVELDKCHLGRNSPHLNLEPNRALRC